MANTKTAKRQIKVTARKTKINRVRKNDYRTSLKLVEKAILDKDQKREVVINPRRQTRRKSTRRKTTRRKR